MSINHNAHRLRLRKKGTSPSAGSWEPGMAPAMYGAPSSVAAGVLGRADTTSGATSPGRQERWARSRTSWAMRRSDSALQRTPASHARMQRRWGYARACASATAITAPSRVSGDTSVTSQHKASPSGVAPYTRQSRGGGGRPD